MPLPKAQGLYDPAFEHDACGPGFVAELHRRPSHDVVVKGLEILRRLAHRGVAGCDPYSGDGSGILLQLPRAFYERSLARHDIELPNAGDYGVAMAFLSRDPHRREAQKHILEDAVRYHNQKVIAWRDVPVDSSVIGPVARASQPVISQLFIGRVAPLPVFERSLFMIRRRAGRIAKMTFVDHDDFYLASLSSKTVVYKGLTLPGRLDAFYYKDLRDAEVKSSLALVHSRFSTNTFPTWERAHPYRLIAHNGEINTLRGNQTWMAAREPMLESKAFVEHLADFKPIIRPGGSDSASLDNVVDFLRTIAEMTGRTSCIVPKKNLPHPKANLLEFSDVLHPIVMRDAMPASADQTIRPGSSDDELLEGARISLKHGEPSTVQVTLVNSDRAFGARLAGELARRHGADGLPDGTVSIEATGSAGQSFGAFAVRGMLLMLEGEANDYVGKGLSGGVIAIRPPVRSPFRADANVIIGNTVLYGATSGIAFFAGRAGERFAVRNSGAHAVVEGIGDHGCEYMTGGLVVVLGTTGRNFGAGMSGGIAYVLDEDGRFASRCNRSMVELEPVLAGDEAELCGLLEAHLAHTRSEKAASLLGAWGETSARFVKVVSTEFKKIMAAANRGLRVIAHG